MYANFTFFKNLPINTEMYFADGSQDEPMIWKGLTPDGFFLVREGDGAPEEYQPEFLTGKDLRFVFADGTPYIAPEGPFSVMSDSGMPYHSNIAELTEAAVILAFARGPRIGSGFSLLDRDGFVVPAKYYVPALELAKDRARKILALSLCDPAE